MPSLSLVLRTFALAGLIFCFAACANSSSGDATSNTNVDTTGVTPNAGPVGTTPPVSTSENTDADADTDAEIVVAATTPRPTVIPPTAVPPTAVPDRGAEPPTPPTLLASGSGGAAVEDTQDLLNDLIGYANLAGEPIAEDGVYGPNTAAAQRNFESYAGLDVDGVASLQDREHLEQVVAALEAATPESEVTRGDVSEFVGSWQSRLNIWNDLIIEGSASITVDNRFGPDTEQATFAVEEALGLQVDGIVEPSDRAALRSAIARLRAENDAAVIRRTTVGDQAVVVKAFYADDGYCVRLVVGFAADERCIDTPGGDINTAYFATVNGISFVAGTANPNVAFARIGTDGGGDVSVATRPFGNSLARAWVEIVAEEPDNVELLEADGTSVTEMRFSTAPTDRDFFGATISVLSPEYSHTFFVDACSRPGGTDLVLEASLANATLVVNVIDDTGSLVIDSGTDAAPIQISGTISAADVSANEVVVTGEFTGDPFDGAAFTATANC